jgi:hypothetical protein
MSEVGSYKWIEVVLLVGAGGAFVWWQLSDLRRAKASSQEQERASHADPEPSPPGAGDTAEHPPAP